ncbi:hypothetical protein SteCoe_1627 [Stentor coeruleus]|uniref:Uncharacterized protein n=1 Tax=Stentor coeruleus TaxID=5963 RepID=A0A1R2D1G2_9CILI|nr:hypothetical protein SteCoe_1627 [Stentor coeruleus]
MVRLNKDIRKRDYNQMTNHMKDLSQEIKFYHKCYIRGIKHVTSIAKSKDHQLVALASFSGFIEFWNILQHEKIFTLITKPETPLSVAISSCSTMGICGLDSGFIKIWDLKTRLVTKSKKLHNKDVTCLAISDDSSFIVSGSDDTKIKIWYLVEKKKAALVGGHFSKINSIVLTNDNKKAISASMDKTVRVWDLEKLCEERVLRRELQVAYFAFLSKNNEFAVAVFKKFIVVLDFESSQCISYLRVKSDIILSACLTENDEVVVAGYISGKVRYWNILEKRIITRFTISNIKFIDPIDNFLLIVHNPISGIPTELWKYREKKIEFSFPGHIIPASLLIRSPDRKIAVSFAPDRTIRIWDLINNQELHSIKEVYTKTNALAISPDNSHIFATTKTTISIWNLQTYRKINKIEDQNIQIKCISVTSNNKYYITGLSNGHILLWTIDNNTPIAVLTEHRRKIKSIVTTEDGRIMISTSDDYRMGVWDLEKLTLVCMLPKHKGKISAARFCKRNKYLLVTTMKNTIRVWRIIVNKQCYYKETKIK